MKNKSRYTGLLVYALLPLSGLLLLLHACTKKHDITVPTPTITAVNPAAAKVGDTLTISGSLFSATPGEDLVAIASVSLKVIAATTTQLSVVIPTGAHTGELTVGLPYGMPARWSDSILISGTGAPFVTAVTPSTAYSGDTIVIHGGNFTTPAINTGVTISGAACTILNISDSVIRLLIPDAAYTGPLLVTSSGISSLPASFTVLKIDPLADGRIFWLEPNIGQVQTCSYCYPQPGVVGTTAYRGKDSATAPPYGNTAYTYNTAEFNLQPYSFIGMGSNTVTTANNPVVTDASGNAYYLAITQTTLQDYSTNDEYDLVRLTPSGSGDLNRSVIWSQTYNSNTDTYSNYYPDPVNYPGVYSTYSNEPMPNISIDGNKLYIKIGITNTYYTGDVSTQTPTFTTTTGLVDDSTSFDAMFGTNYIFYLAEGSSFVYSGLNEISQVRYMPRGGTASQPIDLDPGMVPVAALADPSHGDNVLILATNGQPSYSTTGYATIYKFNAATQILTKLYDKTNWSDAPYYSTVNLSGMTTGILWAGTHIYYANDSRTYTYNPQSGGGYAYNGLYRLDDDGSSIRPYNVYPRLEPLSSTSADQFNYLFIGSK